MKLLIHPPQVPSVRSVRSAAILTVLSLAACGGGGSDTPAPGSGSTLTIPDNACSAVTRSISAAVPQFVTPDAAADDSGFPKIVNGNTCGPDRSSVVSLAYRSSGGGLHSQFCSGVVIGDHTVLTAGHCLTDAHGRSTSSSTLFVVDGTGANFTVADVNVHPAFKDYLARTGDFSNAPNDVAVVMTDASLGVPAMPILVSRVANSGEEGIVAGFGSTGSGGAADVQGTLQAGKVTVVDQDSTFIRTIYNGDNSNSCFGDSGGPLLLIEQNAFAVAGVVSQGTKSHCEVGDVTTYPNLSQSSNTSFLESAAPGFPRR